MQPPSSTPRGRRTLPVAALDLVRGLRAHGALDSARLMAFNFFLSAVPLLVLLGFVLGRLVRKRGVEAMVGPLLEMMPDMSADLARRELERLAGASAAPIAPLSVVVFLWLTSSGIHQMMDVFERAASAPRRAWWKQRLIALLAVGFGVGAVSFTAWALVSGDDQIHRDDFVEASPVPVSSASAAPRAGSAPIPAPSASAAARSSPAPARAARDARPAAPRPKKHRLLYRVHAPWERVLAGAALLMMAVTSLAFFYRFAVEHPTGIRRRAWPGAFAAMGAWAAVSWGFGAYIASLGAYAVYYGSLAAVAVLLVWLYLTSLALLFGAEINAMLEGVGAHE